MGQAEPADQIGGDDLAGLHDSIFGQRAGTSLIGIWMVTGTARSLGPASIITGFTACPVARVARSARNSV